MEGWRALRHTDRRYGMARSQGQAAADGESRHGVLCESGESAPSHILARAGLRAVRAESVRPERVRSKGAGKYHEAGAWAKIGLSVARNDSPRRRRSRPYSGFVQQIRDRKVTPKQIAAP